MAKLFAIAFLVFIQGFTAGAVEFEPPLFPLPQNLVSEIGVSTLFRQPPYDLDFSGGFTRGGYSGADRNAGAFNAFGIVPRLGDSGTIIYRGSSGVGVYYRPTNDSVVRFTPIIRYDYDWKTISRGQTALSTASLGVFVRSRNLDGSDPQTELDRTFRLWTRMSDGWTRNSESGRDIFFDAQQATVFLNMSRSRIYDIWVFTSVACRGRQSSFWPIPPWSQCHTHVNATVPILAIEEQTPEPMQ